MPLKKNAKAGTQPTKLEQEEEAEAKLADERKAKEQFKAEQCEHREYNLALQAVNRMPEISSGAAAGRWLAEFVKAYRQTLAEPVQPTRPTDPNDGFVQTIPDVRDQPLPAGVGG